MWLAARGLKLREIFLRIDCPLENLDYLSHIDKSIITKLKLNSTTQKKIIHNLENFIDSFPQLSSLHVVGVRSFTNEVIQNMSQTLLANLTELHMEQPHHIEFNKDGITHIANACRNLVKFTYKPWTAQSEIPLLNLLLENNPNLQNLVLCNISLRNNKANIFNTILQHNTELVEILMCYDEFRLIDFEKLKRGLPKLQKLKLYNRTDWINYVNNDAERTKCLSCTDEWNGLDHYDEVFSCIPGLTCIELNMRAPEISLVNAIFKYNKDTLQHIGLLYSTITKNLISNLVSCPALHTLTQFGTYCINKNGLKKIIKQSDSIRHIYNMDQEFSGQYEFDVNELYEYAASLGKEIEFTEINARPNLMEWWSTV